VTSARDALFFFSLPPPNAARTRNLPRRGASETRDRPASIPLFFFPLFFSPPHQCTTRNVTLVAPPLSLLRFIATGIFFFFPFFSFGGNVLCKRRDAPPLQLEPSFFPPFPLLERRTSRCFSTQPPHEPHSFLSFFFPSFPGRGAFERVERAAQAPRALFLFFFPLLRALRGHREFAATLDDGAFPLPFFSSLNTSQEIVADESGRLSRRRRSRGCPALLFLLPFFPLFLSRGIVVQRGGRPSPPPPSAHPVMAASRRPASTAPLSFLFPFEPSSNYL